MTVTSTHSTTLGRHVAVLISITFGRTGHHYKAHFVVLIRNLDYEDFEDFQERFPGNIADFSAAEKLGFQLSLIELFEDDIKKLAELTVAIDTIFLQTEDLDTTTVKEVTEEVRSQLEKGSYKMKFMKTLKDKVKARLTLLIDGEVCPITSVGDFYIDLEAFWLLCSVHFERTVERISSNHSLVPYGD